MLKSDRLAGALAAVLLLIGALPVQAQGKYGLGQKATPEQIAGWNIDVRPDGAGLPDGQGSVAEGNEVYDANCASCHGTFGESNSYIALTNVGARLNYATTLFDYINRAMPFPHSKSLTANQVYAAAAYVLNLNDIVPADFVADKNTLPKVKMPAHDKVKPFPGLMSVTGTPDVKNVACMKDCAKDVKVTASLPAGFVENLYGDIRDNFRGLQTMNEQAPPVSELPGHADAKATPDVPKLLGTYACSACHAVDHKVVGPAFQDVAAKYQGNAGAVQHLTDKIRKGGAGVWGPIPMPPQSGPSDAELAAIIHWVLSQPAKK